MERILTLREKYLARAVRQRLLDDYQFDVCEDDLLFGLGDKQFSLSRDYVLEAPDLSRVADFVAQALKSDHDRDREAKSRLKQPLRVAP